MKEIKCLQDKVQSIRINLYGQSIAGQAIQFRESVHIDTVTRRHDNVDTYLVLTPSNQSLIDTFVRGLGIGSLHGASEM